MASLLAPTAVESSLKVQKPALRPNRQQINNMLRNMRPAVAVMLALMCASATASPLSWTGVSTSDCSAAPAISPAPTADEQTVFTIRRLGSTVWRMCPGSTHRIQARFPEQRQFFLTASQGAFAGANSADTCTNRVVSPGPMPMADAELILPCDATGFVKLDMISVATPGAKAYKQVTTTLPVNPLSACPASPCHAAAAQANMETGSLSASVQHTSEGVDVQLPAIPSPLSEANPSAPAPAAAAPPKAINIDLSNLFKLPTLSAGSSSDASKPNPAQILSALQKLGGVAAQPTDAATAAAAAPSIGGSVTGGAHPLQALSQINATQAWIVVRQLGQLLNTQDENPTNIKSIMDFVSQAGKILPGASASESAPDLPTAVLNVVKATGKLLPSDRPADIMTVLHFCRTVGDLLGKITAARVPPTGPAA